MAIKNFVDGTYVTLMRKPIIFFFIIYTKQFFMIMYERRSEIDLDNIHFRLWRYRVSFKTYLINSLFHENMCELKK